MEALAQYVKDPAAVLSKGVDTSGRVDIGRLSKSEKLRALGIVCAALSHILETKLHIAVFERVKTLSDQLYDPLVTEDAQKVVELFDAFLVYEERLFEMQGVPRWVAKETFEATMDMKARIASFISNPDSREQWLRTDTLSEQLSKIRETVCAANEANLDRQLENRHILGGLLACAVNTGADMLLSTVVIFNIISSVGGAIVTWRRVNW